MGVNLKNKFLTCALILIFVLFGCVQSTSKPTPQSSGVVENQQSIVNNPSIGEFVARCCYDTVKEGIVLYSNQFTDAKKLVYEHSDGSRHGLISIFGAIQGFLKLDVFELNSYCNNGGRIAPSVANNKDGVDATDPLNGKDSLSTNSIILNFDKSIETTTIDECILIVKLKNGNTITKKFIVKMIGLK